MAEQTFKDGDVALIILYKMDTIFTACDNPYSRERAPNAGKWAFSPSKPCISIIDLLDE